jgi:hypothetical protein
MRSAVPAFTVSEVPLELEPVTADPFIDALESVEEPRPQERTRLGRNSLQECRSSAAARRRSATSASSGSPPEFLLEVGTPPGRPDQMRQRRVGTGGVASLAALATVCRPDAGFEDLE